MRNLATVAALALGFCAGGPLAAAERSLVELLEHAGAYVQAYEDDFRLVVAEEEYTQRRRVAPTGPIHETRILRSDVVFVRIPETTLPWWLLRDVYEVDGKPVRDRQARLEQLLVNGPQGGFERARAIADEGARYNLGRAFRNFNIPTLVLAFLHPALQPRFSFERRGESTIEGRRFVELAFRELGPPTLVHGTGAHRELPASGRVLVHDGTDGVLARTELVLDTPGEGATTRTTLVTDYRPDAALRMWVPVEMRERLQSEVVSGRGYRGPVESIEGFARYYNFRKAAVSTREEYRVAGEEKKEEQP